ncbi:ribbon-helix-helix domain-containing protein [Agarivorans sp. MS3-6]|uniref:ribbon-helix-helix domain-containing protein n=1 Tax=Agarivorans sp. TSD2052 TaxID=2937286 RepID=UPI00200DCC32|nr:ribbon-helix-helix domain-containing protein [Agarivorans sp. TSD2052]UPW17572.1 ribbon-helix-helix domain-containing protein [Agarivorans sp. TSD2052]
MCEIYSGTETALFELKARSVRLDGVVTSIRLEAIFWQLLEQIANEADLSLAAFLTQIYHEVLQRDEKVGNFTSLLRVACTTYLNQGERLVLNKAKPKQPKMGKSIANNYV